MWEIEDDRRKLLELLNANKFFLLISRSDSNLSRLPSRRLYLESTCRYIVDYRFTFVNIIANPNATRDETSRR